LSLASPSEESRAPAEIKHDDLRLLVERHPFGL